LARLRRVAAAWPNDPARQCLGKESAMDVVTGLAAEAADLAATLVHVECDDLDLSSLYGMLELQDRLEQAIAEARWGSTSTPAG
jgi:hypothetical protein